MTLDPLYAMEFRRCLIAMDVAGITRMWEHVAPHLPKQSPEAALCSLHMARADAESMPLKLRQYSREWLFERGFDDSFGKWELMVNRPITPIAEAVGIASGNASGWVGPINKKIVRAMQDALLNGMEKGVTEPPRQKELMLKARAKVRFKARMA